MSRYGLKAFHRSLAYPQTAQPGREAYHRAVTALYQDLRGQRRRAPDKSSGKRRQSIHIKYGGIGFIPPDELMKVETAWPKSRRPLKTQDFQAIA